MPKEQAASVSMDNQHVTENYSKVFYLFALWRRDWLERYYA